MEIGRVREIWRYPVKSMAGESLEEARVSWHGLDGDRRAAFVRGDDHSGFPWLTARQVPELVRYRPFYRDPDDVRHSPLLVETPDERHLALDDAELQAELAGLYGRPLSLIRIKRGVFDSLPLSLMSTATLATLDERLDFALDGRRFRQNIIIETFDGRPFAEESWVGSALAIGEVQVWLNQRIERCQMINVDPDTAVRTSATLKLVAQTRDNCAGMGCTPQSTGWIQVGDVVRLRDA
ncbi:MAG: MOSC domain-containing protein [Chloroflexi bacterium]|nr:MOSC domain-containing protein [Ardenticatenaceae bacterium]NOG33494.1 MOSC domain-containing protein [Chloroflexota bacterium]